MQGANLSRAQLQGADLSEAQLQGANLQTAELQGADFFRAELQGADLSGALFDDATDLAAATLRGAAVSSVDFTSVPQIELFLDEIYGDASVKLPSGARPRDEGWPTHWEKTDLGWAEHEEAWRAWQATLPPGWDQPDDPKT